MIRSDRDGDILTLTIDRPDKANSLTAAMLSDLIRAVRGAGDVRLLILTGAGESVFSAGADLEEARAGLATSALWEDLSGAIAALPCLTVAALNGTLAGGAFGMALACDLRLSVPQASFFYPVAKLGFLPQPSDPARMARLIGPARTKMILAGGARLDASEALSFGLVDRVVIDPVTAARDLAVGTADHMAAIKAMVSTGT
ncbi:enoyl-CoA hydratase/isomerase family protein [Jannaschia donghaensis]|uniref:Carnitinyl-CoA dehydratase n=1 Tax=Jannaschia donghaensis TaxID=420998 RepID=A0A0M6YJY0_9RHOB|nr:enoyl-CoA hydratase/isomerase family protein [Jannaschia donghaensis]CTQ49366.1 Carnitinyl-CoA dehydratase [Jannaschia donghaensis]